MGLKAIKKRYWDSGNLQTEAYYRRKNIDDEWIWVAGKVSNVMETPLAGLIIQERRPTDEDITKRLNKFTRIASIVADVIEKSYSWTQLKNENNFSSISNKGDTDIFPHIPGLAEETAALKAFLNGNSDNTNKESLQQMMDSAKSSAAQNLPSQSSSKPDSSAVVQKGNDAISSVLEQVSSGPCVHISEMPLSPTMVKMIILLIAGYLHIDALALFMLNPENATSDMDEFLQYYVTLLNSNIHHDQPRQSNHSRRRRNSDRRSFHEMDMTSSIPAGIQGPFQAPPIAAINLSYTAIGDDGMEECAKIFAANTPSLITIDVSFCNIGERGMLALCRALNQRKRIGLPGLQGVTLSGNTITFKAAKELGSCLAPASATNKRSKRQSLLLYHDAPKEGYDEDDEYGSDDYDDDDDEDILFGGSGSKRGNSRRIRQRKGEISKKPRTDDPGIKLLRVASTSMAGADILELLINLTEECSLVELDISSNHIGVEGVTMFVDFLEGKSSKKNKKGSVVMPKLNRINISNNNLGNDGIAKLTRAISRRQKSQVLVDLHLSFNNVESLGTGTIMNKLLQHNLVNLSLDNNAIGDSGCQLVAASLTSMHYLSRLNLSFNQIGCRGITSLMRALLGCETITYLGLSGNVMKITGAIAMGFALAHHPRLAHLDLDNCCLSQVAQCHISAGMISNRWVPMQIVNGFRVGPPLAAIGALDIIAQHLGNNECLSIRRNMQMKANLQWMEAQKASRDANKKKESGDMVVDSDGMGGENMNGPPSQSAYLRMLDWLSRIPFDDDELDNLRRYFYDVEDESPDGLRGSDGRLNLKVRGDLLAALGSTLEKEMRENEQNVVFPEGPSVGMFFSSGDANDGDSDGLDDFILSTSASSWNIFPWVKNKYLRERNAQSKSILQESDSTMVFDKAENEMKDSYNMMSNDSAKSALKRSDSQRSTSSATSQQDNKNSKSLKARISMFPQFLEKLDLLKHNAQDMMDAESDPMQQDIIAQQFAEASLILLRQLRYHCMNSGLDGWRQGKIRRKVLIVDDSKVTRKLVARAFEKANFIVDTAENGEEGVKMMKESIYDIAFMDIDMPVMNGFDATKALREWENSSRPGARQPICALTAAYVDDFEIHELMKFKEAGLDVMESKPCNIPRLFKVVDDVSPMFSDLSISVTKHKK